MKVALARTARTGRADTARRWWNWQRIAAAVLVAAFVAGFAFLYRFNTLGGAFGGFDNDHFAHLMRTDALLHGEQPLRDFVDDELRGAWPTLSYAVPAWAQRIGGRNLLSEAYLTVGALALAHTIVFLLALDLSKSWAIALLATAIAIVSGPKLYNYPKVVSLALGALALTAVLKKPTKPRLAFAAFATAVALLFRHDYAVYVFAAIVVGIVARDPAEWKATATRLGLYGLMTGALLLPSAIWVQVYEGIPTYIRRSLETSQLETARTQLRQPAFAWLSPFAEDSLLAAGYYACWAILAVGAVTLIWRLAWRSQRPSPAERGTVLGLLAMAGLVTYVFLRANLSQRFGDAIVPLALVGAWAAGSALALDSRTARAAAMAPAIAVMGVALVSFWIVGETRRELETGGLTESWEQTSRRFVQARSELVRLPPAAWTDQDSGGTLIASRYVEQCTAPDDHLLVAAYQPELNVFARRLFAAGQATVSLSFYKSDEDQRRALARLERQSVPIIVADYEDFEEQFVTDYPILWRHVSEHYTRAGNIDVNGEPRFIVFTEKARQPARTYPGLGLPCFR